MTLGGQTGTAIMETEANERPWNVLEGKRRIWVRGLCQGNTCNSIRFALH